VIAPTLRSVKASKKLHLLLAARVLRRLAKKFAVMVQGVLESPLMHGRKDQKKATESGNTVSGELDEQALTGDLKRVVEESDLSIPKIASKPSVCGLRALLSRLIQSYLRLKVFLNGKTEILRAGVIVRCQKRSQPTENILPLLPVCSRYGRTTPREELARSYHIPVPTTTRSADQLQHRSDSGCPCDPAPSRDQAPWTLCDRA
jgi:hypothetical protein